jgi:hypothetical protein
MQIGRFLLVACVATCAAVPEARAQNVTERSVEARTLLSFQVPTAAVQKMLPAGWVVEPSNAPATRGGNLNMTMMERLMVVDKDGAPVGSGTSRYVTITVPAKNAETGRTGTLVIGGISPDAPGAYDVYLPATTARVERAAESQGVQAGKARETWEFASTSGERITMTVSYRRGQLTKSHADTVVRSGRHPDFQRTYHIDQAADVLRSLTSSENRVDAVTFKATGGFLSALFDGSEKLLSVTSVPWYSREITVP